MFYLKRAASCLLRRSSASFLPSSSSFSLSNFLYQEKDISAPIASARIHFYRMASTRSTTPLSMSTKKSSMTLPRLPIFEAIASHDSESTAVVHSVSGRRFTYGELLGDVAEAKDRLVREAGGRRIEGERIAFLVENSYDYIVTLLSIIGAQSIALPLSPAFPSHELKYILDHSRASFLLSSAKFEAKAQEVLNEDLAARPQYVKLEKKLGGGEPGEVILDGFEDGEGGMMLYTSGTTSRPKGVVLPTKVLIAQANSLLTAWNYSPTDHLLHVLPLHHIHGTVNAILSPLLAGSAIEFLFPFNPTSVWTRFAQPFLPDMRTSNPITFFTVVPTVYNRLLSTFDSLPPAIQTAAKKAISPQNLRLNISGSAALPTPTKKAWETLSNGNILLERYGMTEVGMALSCGLSPALRVDGSVGFPLPTVEVRLYDTETKTVIPHGSEIDGNGRERDGEIQLRGPTIFKEYWDNAEATAKEFMEDEEGGQMWFRTGDIAVRRFVPLSSQTSSLNADSKTSTTKSESETKETTLPTPPPTPSPSTSSSTAIWSHGPMYFIRGRQSSDIIKSGGEKVSALEVERELLSLPQIEEVAVVAVPSGKWGQKVGAVVILKEGSEGKGGKKWGALDMRRALKERLAAYKIPQVMTVVDSIPRNAMGKINKKELVKAVFVDDASGDEM